MMWKQPRVGNAGQVMIDVWRDHQGCSLCQQTRETKLRLTYASQTRHCSAVKTWWLACCRPDGGFRVVVLLRLAGERASATLGVQWATSGLSQRVLAVVLAKIGM